ncbi:MAG: LysR family transcriptional regulator [Clostridia bacterium]|nr:LysR family transcriptional regulator [Clostridia bacterium]
MLDVFLLEQLDAFARAGTLSKAAEALHITEPALSRNMKKLEDVMGVPLFDRQNRKIALNETGKVAAEYARRALDANLEVVNMAVAFDRRERSIALGSCTVLPIYEITPLLQERFMGKSITTEVVDNEKLLTGLRERRFHLVILAGQPNEKDVCFQRFHEDRLCVSFPPDHPLTKKEAITFADLENISVIAAGNAGYWQGVCERNMPRRNLVVQHNVEALVELVGSSSMPVFSSSRLVEQGNAAPGRITLPILDDAAHAVFYLTCLASEKQKYASLFNAVRSQRMRFDSTTIPFLSQEK